MGHRGGYWLSIFAVACSAETTPRAQVDASRAPRPDVPPETAPAPPKPAAVNTEWACFREAWSPEAMTSSCSVPTAQLKRGRSPRLVRKSRSTLVVALGKSIRKLSCKGSPMLAYHLHPAGPFVMYGCGQSEAALWRDPDPLVDAVYWVLVDLRHDHRFRVYGAEADAPYLGYTRAPFSPGGRFSVFYRGSSEYLLVPTASLWEFVATRGRRGATPVRPQVLEECLGLRPRFIGWDPQDRALRVVTEPNQPAAAEEFCPSWTLVDRCLADAEQRPVAGGSNLSTGECAKVPEWTPEQDPTTGAPEPPDPYGPPSSRAPQ